MSISQLPNKRYRAQVYDPASGSNVSVAKVLGLPRDRSTFATKREAKAAREDARRRLRSPRSATTVAEFRDRWLSDPLFARPKQSTMLHNAERTSAFAAKYGEVALRTIGDELVAEWLAGGKRNSTVAALRAMFNDAGSAKAGRLVDANPFSDLGISRTVGNKHKQPPTEEQVRRMVAEAWKLTPPSFAAYLEFACCTAIRPGELDALRPDAINYEAGDIYVREQFNARTRTFTDPKYGPYTAALVGRAREILLTMPREVGADTFVFTTIRGTHYTPSSRTHHWNRVRAAVGLGHVSLYLATRHYFAWYALNVLDLDPHVVAEQLGHRDGGKLIVSLYGHPDKARARQKIRDADDRHQRSNRLRLVVDGSV